MTRVGFRRCSADPQLFVGPQGRGLVMIFADDIVIVCVPEDTEIIKKLMSDCFSFKIKREPTPLGQTWRRYLGKEYRRATINDKPCMLMRVPPAYWDVTLSTAGMSECKPMATPGETKPMMEDKTEALDTEQAHFYRTLIGRLMWTIEARPDMSFGIKECARMVSTPTQDSWRQLQHVLRYAQGTKDYVLKLGDGPRDGDDAVTAITDASWASGRGRKSTMAALIFFRGVLLLSMSRTQGRLALSSAEAELEAMVTGTQEAEFVTTLLEEIKVIEPRPMIVLHGDSNAALGIAARIGLGRLKHVELRLFWLQDEVRAGTVRMVKEVTELIEADLLTKFLNRARHETLCRRVGLIRDGELSEQ